MEVSIDQPPPALSVVLTAAVPDEKHGLKGDNFDYDPDLAHPAAGYQDHEPVTLPDGMSERRLITKIDLHVIPALSILYLLAFLDRTNVANAAIFGLQKDLGLSATQYSTALTIFFVPYVSPLR